MARTPAYQTVYEALKEAIQSKTYATGSLLPPEPELEKMFDVSRTTVRKAISLLVGDGLIRVQQGYGTEVVDYALPKTYHKFHNITKINEKLHGDEASFNVKGMHIDQTAASTAVAQALQIAPGQPVYRIQRLPLIDDKPFGIMTNYLLPSLVPGLDQYSNTFANLYDFLADRYDLLFLFGDEVVSAATVDFIESELLGIPPGAPVLFFKRIAHCEQGPFEYVETKLRPDRYELNIHMEGPPPSDLKMEYSAQV